MENRKRKREPEIDAPRIKYHVEQLARSFERILKEDSYEEMCNAVRRKLKLDNTTRLELVQLRDGRLYDLEDDDDFEAFKVAAAAYSSLDVRVTFTLQDVAHPDISPVSTTHRASDNLEKSRFRGKKKHLSSPQQATIQISSAHGGPEAAAPFESDEEDLLPPKKKRKKSRPEDVEQAPGTASDSNQKKSKGNDPSTLQVNQVDEQEPPKKRKKNKNMEGTVVPRQDATSPIVATSKVKKKKTKKANKLTVSNTAPSPQSVSQPEGMKLKDMWPPSLETPTSKASTSAYSVSLAHDLVSAVHVVPRSPASRVKSATLEWHQKPSTPEEIATTYEVSGATAKKKSQLSIATNKEVKGKEKAEPKVSARKSHLRESWIPRDNDDTSPVLRATETPYSSSVSSRPLSEKIGTSISAAPASSAVVSSTKSAIPATAFSTVPVNVSTPSAAAVIAAVPATVPAAVSVPVSPLLPRAHATPRSLKKPVSTLSCPICLGQPFHLQYLCPIIKLGSSAIQKRIAELEAVGGEDDLITELRVWLTKMKPKGADLPGLRNADYSLSLRDDLGNPFGREAWVGMTSEVFVESRDEDSEYEESSTSDSASKVKGVNDNGRKMAQFGTRLESQSESDLEPSSSSGPTTGPRTRTPSVDLDGVNLEKLMRGSIRKTLVDFVDEEEESDDTEQHALLLEDEDEEKVQHPHRSKGRKVKQSSSSEDVDEEDENGQDSEVEPAPEKPDAFNIDPPAPDKGSLIKDSSLVNTDVAAEQSEDADIEASPIETTQLQQGSNANPPSVSKEATTTNTSVGGAISEKLQIPPPPESNPTILPLTTPPRPSTSPPATHLRTPLVQHMKDRSGNLPLNPPDDDTGIRMPTATIIEGTPAPPPAEEVGMPKRGRGRPRGSSQTKATTRSRSRSVTVPPSTSPAVASTTPSSAAPKRRGRPPLSEAVKAERKAIKDAEKAARNAEKRIRLEKKQMTGKATAPRNNVVEQQVAPLGSGANSAPASQSPVSQWQTLSIPTESSVVSKSSPAIDQLSSSSPAVPFGKNRVGLGGVAVSGDVDGIKSPGAVSVTTSVSRKHDEDDVEQIVGSQKTPDEQDVPPAKRQSLFLPGASQLTQTQTLSRVFNHQADGQAPVLDEWLDSSSSTDTEAESREDEITQEKPVVPPSSLKSTFPSLSQLSFDKFRPTFLLPGRGLSQNKAKEQDAQQSEESESDDEDSNAEKEHSHIPKGRLAGAGVVKKRKSRGLLHAS